MRVSVRALSCVIAAMVPAPVLAQDARWSLFAEDGSCEISFVEELVDDGIMAIDRFGTCGPSIDQITGYALNNEGALLLFYSTFHGVELVGTVTRDSDSLFKGTLRKGGVLQLEHRSGTMGIPDPLGGSVAGEDSGTVESENDPEAEADAPLVEAPPRGPCLALAGQETACAPDADLGPPEGGEMQMLTRLNLRNIPGTDGSSVIGRVEAGACVTVNLCMEDGQERLWCGVSTDAGEGFVLKQDDKTVYARNSCP